MKKVFCYIRLTVKEQNETSYLADLLEAGVPKNHIYIEKYPAQIRNVLLSNG